MVPILNVLLYLLLGSLQLLHDLLVSLFDSLTIVTLSFQITLVVLSLNLLVFVPCIETLLVDLSKPYGLLLLTILSIGIGTFFVLML